MGKIAKIMMIVFMIIGIAFSISNFISVELKADDDWGAWEYFPNGKKACMGAGQECKKNSDIGEPQQ
jgi:hypothetical protein